MQKANGKTFLPHSVIDTEVVKTATSVLTGFFKAWGNFLRCGSFYYNCSKYTSLDLSQSSTY